MRTIRRPWHLISICRNRHDHSTFNHHAKPRLGQAQDFDVRLLNHTMNWNRDKVSRLLSATITDEPLPHGGHLTIVHFEDARMRYELWIEENGVFLAADPERPIQGLPFFEIGLPCTVLAPVRRSAMPTGLGMYSGPISSATLRFSITRREDGSISLSGAWEGLTAAHECNETVA